MRNIREKEEKDRGGCRSCIVRKGEAGREREREKGKSEEHQRERGGEEIEGIVEEWQREEDGGRERERERERRDLKEDECPRERRKE